MNNETDIRLWGTIVGWLILLFAGGVAWGRHQKTLETHSKAIEDCHMEDLMTEDKCTRLHDNAQEKTEIMLSQMKETQVDLKEELGKYQIQLSAAIGRIENITGRLERRQHDG